jgi:hypothetical protein
MLNVETKLPQGWPVPALDWRTISLSVDRARGTTALLTGNDTAVKFAAAQNYPVGAELALTTWLEQDDPHWFGARIPGTFVSLETLTVERGPDGKPRPAYHRYEGSPAHEVTAYSAAAARTDYMLGMGWSEMP